MAEKKIELVDWGNTGVKLKGKYHGQKNLCLEGRIIELENGQIKLGLAGPWPEDIRKTEYDPDKAAFNIYIAASDEVRIAILKITYLYVPQNTKKITVYET